MKQHKNLKGIKVERYSDLKKKKKISSINTCLTWAYETLIKQNPLPAKAERKLTLKPKLLLEYFEEGFCRSAVQT